MQDDEINLECYCRHALDAHMPGCRYGHGDPSAPFCRCSGFKLDVEHLQSTLRELRTKLTSAGEGVDMTIYSDAPHKALLEQMADPDGHDARGIYEAFIEEAIRVCEENQMEFARNGHGNHEIEPVITFIRDVLDRNNLLIE